MGAEVDNHSSQALQLLEEDRSAELDELLNDLHPVELVSVITAAPADVQDDLIKRISGLDQISELIAYGSDHIRQHALELLDEPRIAAVIRRLELDDAADVIATLSRRKQTAILRRVSPKQARQIRNLLAYDEETAGGIMTPLCLRYLPYLTADETLRDIRSRLHSEEIDPDIDLTYVYVVDENKVLQGVCSLREILTAAPDTLLSELMNEQIVSVSPEDDQEKVARMIADYDFSSLPVVSPTDNTLLGIITVDDVLDVIEDEHTEDMLKLAGTMDEDIAQSTSWSAIKSRFPWLVASWLGGLVGALLLGEFASTLEKIVALAFFMPVVFGMAGNVGSQSSTITVRGIATGEVSEHRSFGRIKKEALTGLSLGLIFGCLLAGAAFVLFRQPILSIIVGLSITITMTCASSFGAILPLFFRRFGVDPAVASGPLVTTSMDLLSITIYFTVATMLLQYW
ncbi:MAG: magnesium transporter [Bdellovibrionales bacterium]|nr:magnesium transporter [Bdellovibrionales bacterium]